MCSSSRVKKDTGLVVAIQRAIYALAILLPIATSAQTNCAPPPPGLVSWWRAEDNALDWTGGNNGTIEGGVTYGPGKVGEAFVLNGNDCGVEVGSPANLQLQNFTLEAWIQRATNTVATSDGSGAGCFFSTHLGWYVGIYNDGIVVLYDTESGNEVDSSVGLTDTAWHHIAVSKNGTNVVFYVDGNGYTSAPFNDTFVFSGEAAIGGYSSDGVYYESFYGSIDELSIYDQALPASEIRAIYNAESAGKCITNPQNNCVPAASGLVSWWRAEGNALDWIGGNNGTIDGDTIYGPGKVGQAFVFNGYQGGVLIGSPTNLVLENYTIEAWIQRATNTVTTLDSEFSTGGYFFGYFGQDWNGYGFGIVNDGTVFLSQGLALLASPVQIEDTNFHHVAVTASGTNVVFYIDGTDYLPTQNNPEVYDYLGSAVIGCANENLTGTFYGSIDELSIYNQALPASEIRAIYNAGSAGKCSTPNSSPTIVLQPTNQTVTIGDQVSFAVSATSFGTEGYRWSFDGTNIEGATNSVLALDDVQFSQAGTYTVTVTNANGGTPSSNAMLTVVPAQCVPAPSGIVSWWRAEGNAIDRVSGNNGVPDAPANTPPAETIDYGPGKVGEGFVLNGYGIQLISTNNLDLQDFTIECWIQRLSAVVASPGNSDTGCFFGFGTGGYGFGMYNSGQMFLAAIDGTETASSIEVADTNFHHVAATKSSTNVIFYVDGVAYPAASIDVIFNNNTPAAIGARGDTMYYQFYGTIDELSIYNRPLSGGEIAAIYGASIAGKCVPPLPVLVSQPASQTLTAYSPANFAVFADGPLPLIYQWIFDGTNLAGATNSNLAFPALPSEAGTYRVIVGTAPNVTNSSNAILTVTLPPPPTILREPAGHIGVVDDYTTFAVVAQSQAPVPTYYQWSFDGTNLTGATNNELVISNLTLANAGTYSVQISNPFFATNSRTALLTMIPAPTGTNRIVANPDPNELTRAMDAGGSVKFVCNGTITLLQPLVLSRDVVLDASNYAVTISGEGRNQLIAILSGVNVTLRNITLSAGFAVSGGAISNSGALTVSNVNFLGNDATSMGGAIFNAGTALLTSVTFSNNAVNGAGDDWGGALYNNGIAGLTNVIFSSNVAGTPFYVQNGGSAFGGGLFNQGGTVNLHNVCFDDNVAQGGSVFGSIGQNVAQGNGFGGALCSLGGRVTGNLIECTNNAALSGEGQPVGFGPSPVGLPGAGVGGAFCLTNCVTILSNGWFVSNSTSCSAAYSAASVGSEGGALFNAGWTALIDVGFVSNNCAGVDGVDGQILYDDPEKVTPGGAGGGAVGGAVYNMGLLAMTDCTFTTNSVAGGSGGAGGTCTFCIPQQTGPSGAPGDALGGALANFGTVTIVSNSFLNNSASGPGTDVGTIYSVCNLQLDTNNTTIFPYTVESVSNASAPFLALEPQSQVVLVGSTVTLNALAVASPAPTYQWAWDGTNLLSATAATLVLTNAQPGESGTYWVEAMNSSGSVTSAPVAVTVLTAPISLTGTSLGSAGFSVSGLGVAGMNFVIEGSTDLEDWQPLQTNFSPFTFIDTNDSTVSNRYYRAIVTH